MSLHPSPWGQRVPAPARKLINVAAFNVGWFASIFAAAEEVYWLGPVGVAAVLGVHLALHGPRAQELALAAMAGAMGVAFDTVLIALRVYEPNRWLLPWPMTTLWLVAMWANFAPLLNVSLRMLKGRYVLSGALGAFGGASSYYAGQRLGAITLSESLSYALAALAVGWALAVPALVALGSAVERRFAGPARATSAGSDRGPR